MPTSSHDKKQESKKAAKSFSCVTLFPEMFQAISEHGVTRRAIQQGLVELKTINPRDFTEDKHRTVDDRPYGGGPGMLMMVEPLRKAIESAKQSSHVNDTCVVYLSPQGEKFSQEIVTELSAKSHLVLVCGRYEGIDERIIETQIDREISIGDFVLSGGELPAMVMMDALIREIPTALGHKDSAAQDSFADGLLDCPHYTRPEELDGLRVPDVLLSGNHAEIERWRMKQALGRTWLRRPDLLEQLSLSSEQQALLDEFKNEQ